MGMKSVATAAVLVTMTAVQAWGSVGPGGDRGVRTPPAEAVAACAELSEGAHVQLTDPRGEAVSATCRMDGALLVAVPDAAPPAPAGEECGSCGTTEKGPSPGEVHP
jgi:hypothetical protein